MGIDVYLSWRGQTRQEKAAQDDAYLSLDGGSVGYLRESYTGGPYVTKILVRDAFESPTREAEISAAVLRQRLTNLTEPAYGFDAGDHAAREITNEFQSRGATVPSPRPSRTLPMSVEEAIALRYENSPSVAREVLRSVRAFVELAHAKELEANEPCTVTVEL